EAGECVSRGVDYGRAEWKDTEVVARDSEAQQRATSVLERGHPVADRLLGTRHGIANDVSDSFQLRPLMLRNTGQVVDERSHLQIVSGRPVRPRALHRLQLREESCRDTVRASAPRRGRPSW